MPSNNDLSTNNQSICIIEKANPTLSISEKKINEYDTCISEKVKCNSKKDISNTTKELTKRTKSVFIGSSLSSYSTSSSSKNKDNKCNNAEDNYLIIFF